MVGQIYTSTADQLSLAVYAKRELEPEYDTWLEARVYSLTNLVLLQNNFFNLLWLCRLPSCSLCEVFEASTLEVPFTFIKWTHRDGFFF